MRRASRQKMNGDGRDWTCRRSRRIIKGFESAGVGKSIKRKLARARRHTPIERDE